MIAALNPRKELLAVVAAVVAAVTALSFATGVAQAKETEEQIKSGCASEVGGTYTTSTSNGHTTSKSCYEGIFGVTHCDVYVYVYVDGEWDEGQSFNEQSPKPPLPGAPPVVPPGELSPDQQNPPPKGPMAPPVTPLPAQVG